MMTYFEVKDRLDNLVGFRDLYREYIDFTNRENNIPALMVRKKMEPLADLAVDSLKRVKLGGLVTRDAPVRGGRKIRINLIKAIFRDHIIRRFSLDEKTPIEIIDRGIIEYRKLLWFQRIQLFNPVFWLYHVSGFMAELPILICRRAGYDTRKAEELTSVRFYMILFQIAFFYVVIKWSGLIDWIRFDILAL